MSDAPTEPDPRERVRAWVDSQRSPYQPGEPWTARALRGSVVRSFAFMPLAFFCGLPHSLQQALFTVGISTGLLSVLTFGERWLTQRGMVDKGLAAVGGLAAWALSSAALILFALQIGAGFADAAWTAGPTEASQLLLDKATELDLGALIVAAFVTLPVGVNAASYLWSLDALEAMGPSVGLSLRAGAAVSVLLLVVILVMGGHSPFLGALMLGCCTLIYLMMANVLMLLGLHFLNWIEWIVFRGRPTRWDVDVSPRTRLRTYFPKV